MMINATTIIFICCIHKFSFKIQSGEAFSFFCSCSSLKYFMKHTIFYGEWLHITWKLYNVTVRISKCVPLKNSACFHLGLAFFGESFLSISKDVFVNLLYACLYVEAGWSKDYHMFWHEASVQQYFNIQEFFKLLKNNIKASSRLRLWTPF